MTVFQTTYQFSPEISIDFDEGKKVYIGRMLSHSGWEIEFEGPDMNSVNLQLEEALREEYYQFERSVGAEERSTGRGRGGGSGGLNVHDRAALQKEREQNTQFPFWQNRILQAEIVGNKRYVIDEYHPEANAGRLAHMTIQGLEYWGMVKALMGGNLVSFFSSLILMIGLGRKARYVAFVAGQRVTASSRNKLRKAIMVKRNQLLQAIVQNVRIHSKNKQLAVQSVSRLRLKKKEAIHLGKASWERRTSLNRPRSDWQGRVGDLRRQIKNTRGKSLDLWEGRVV